MRRVERAAGHRLGALEPAHQRHQQQAREGEADAGEGQRRKVGEGALGDAEIDAPDERDEEHAEVGQSRRRAGGRPGEEGIVTGEV